MKLLRQFLDYVRPSWEERGKFSYRRATQFVFVQLIVWLVVKQGVNTQWQFYTLIVVALLFMFVARLLTAREAIDGIRAAKGLQNNTYEEDIPGTTIVNPNGLRDFPDPTEAGTESSAQGYKP